MNIKFNLERKFSIFFESKEIRYLKSLGVDFHEDDPNNFIPIAKHRKMYYEIIKELDIQKLEDILMGNDKKD
ncbi:hypothetical protein [Cytobacillus dafuensis]|uniref:Uncharacterized protein n=1 Tax=Cytobacillus dafuensis TaxID=1742359 RepID=A0A5B8Z1Y8_CYTDA|nr:hypothetical protein [Cytobacillus dafuensis]QED47005.1 hypothetical protein FSZ17_06980 [Cytobacillus dafuensis]